MHLIHTHTLCPINFFKFSDCLVDVRFNVLTNQLGEKTKSPPAMCKIFFFSFLVCFVFCFPFLSVLFFLCVVCFRLVSVVLDAR